MLCLYLYDLQRKLQWEGKRGWGREKDSVKESNRERASLRGREGEKEREWLPQNKRSHDLPRQSVYCIVFTVENLALFSTWHIDADEAVAVNSSEFQTETYIKQA